MEKRRVAPGYLDTGVTMLTPVRVGRGKEEEKEEGKVDYDDTGARPSKEGEELDRMFGGMAF